jgi:WD40 repeat protein
VILSLAFSPDGKLIAGGGRDGKIRVWDAKSGAPIGSSIGEHALDGNRHDLNGVFSVKFSPNGRTIASGGGDGTIRL